MCTGLMWLRIGVVVGHCEDSNEIPGSLKCMKFLTSRGTISISKITLSHVVN
jgi:hypothetical protein